MPGEPRSLSKSCHSGNHPIVAGRYKNCKNVKFPLTKSFIYALLPYDKIAIHKELPLQKGDAYMNKQDLVSNVADHSGLSKSDAAKAVDAVVGSITGALKIGGEVRLVGFGTFSTSKRKASTGRNPGTGEPMQIPASTQAKFKAGKGLKDAVNK